MYMQLCFVGVVSLCQEAMFYQPAVRTVGIDIAHDFLHTCKG